jgi:hypothetical protein
MRISSPLMLAVAAVAAWGGYAARPDAPPSLAGPPRAAAAAMVVAADVADTTPEALAARELAMRVLRASPAELAALFKAELALKPRDDLKIRFLLLRWSQLAPEPCLAALAAAEGLDCWGVVLRSWMERDGKAAADWLVAHAAMVPAQTRLSMATHLAELLGDERLLALDYGKDVDIATLRGNIFRKLWESSREEALRRIGTPDAPGEDFQMAGSIMESWAMTDPSGVMAWISLMKDPGSRSSYMKLVAQNLGESDPRRALDWMAGEKVDLSDLGDAINSVLDKWGQKTPLEALQWCRSRTPEGDRSGAAWVFGIVAAKGLANGMRMLTEAGFDSSAALQICRGWNGPEDDSQAKAQWAELRALPPGKPRDLLAARIAARLGGMAEKNPGLLAEWEAVACDPQSLRLLRAETLNNQSSDDREAALGILRDPSQPVTTSHVYDAARVRPGEVAAALLQRPDATPEHFAQLISGWEEVDPAGAGRWVVGLPPSPAAERAAREVAYYWAVEDPGAASSWVASLPASPLREAAAAGLATTLSFNAEYGEESFAWAASLRDSMARARAVAPALKAWMKRDPDAAAAGVRASGLPEAEKISFLRSAGFAP